MRFQRVSSRVGTVLIAVLVCLGVATTLVLAAVQVSIGQRRQIRQVHQLEQTRWLMDAGVSKAVSRLQADPDYAGEMLQITPALEKYPHATIEIAVNRSDDDRVGMHVTARLTASGELAATMQRSREFIVDVRDSDLRPKTDNSNKTKQPNSNIEGY